MGWVSWTECYVGCLIKFSPFFFKNLNADNATRHFPALLDDGKPVDLFRLFCLVRERGGMNVVSEEKLWGDMAVAMDLDLNISASLRLIYLKYLDRFDKWLNIISKDGNLVNYSSEYGGALQLFLVELEKRFTTSTVDGDKLVTVGDDRGLQILGSERKNNREVVRDDDGKIGEGEDGISVGPNSLMGENEGQERNRVEGWERMLSWMSEIAKNPSGFCDVVAREFKPIVLEVRKARLGRKYPDEESSSRQKKRQRIGPSFYDDPPVHIEGTRSSSRVAKTPNCPCCTASSSKKSRVRNHSKRARLRKHHLGQPRKRVDHRAPYQLPVQDKVNVGPRFQAEIPPWTGQVSDDDSKWAGTRVWQPNNVNHGTDAHSNEDLVLGKGRSEVCGCPSPGSVECSRLHTAENSTKLKNELDDAFYQWRFDQMGEVVSLGWTLEEEKEFKKVMSTVKLSRAMSKFPGKSREEIIRYLFNVHLQNKRRYQNRVTPDDVDSGDGVSAGFGAVGGRYGDATTNRDSDLNLEVCRLNEQSWDLDWPAYMLRL